MDIKFQAWDKQQKVMLTVLSLNLISKRPTILATLDASVKYPVIMTIPLDEIELLQYTGKKDDKRTDKYPEGQEIYKGHRVKWTSLNFEGEAIGEVTFFEGCWFIQGGYNNGDLYDCLKIEVIGNIYDNPELKD